MGTRGSYGVRVNGVDKLTYMHMDSYPSYLGVNLVTQIRQMLDAHGPDWLIGKAESLKLVPEDGAPDPEVVKNHAKLHPLIGNRDDWYSVLRGYQGKLDEQLGLGLMTDAGGFVQDSLFCEWAYVLDLDTMTFEVYRGFQKAKHSAGRYASDKPNEGGYYPVARVATFPARAVKPEDVQALEAGE